MSCAEMRVLLHGMLDHELDLADAVRVETHMQACQDCTAEYRRQGALRAAIRRSEPRYRAPHDLRVRVITAIQLQTDAPGRAPWWRGAVIGWMSTGVSLALAASLLFVFAIPREQAIQQELISGHVRSLLASHLTDVTTSDQHTVKPWFNGKLDASPPVVDLASQGFPLVGGRLDYIHNHVVGALVFKHDQHVINLFIWPVADANDSGPVSATREGFNLLHWTCSGMTFWAVSDVNPATLRRFEAEYDRQTNGSPQF
jgi:anti-sigma factor (TIGR02949 family)